jgi:AcrR family transcriptional regulator
MRRAMARRPTATPERILAAGFARFARYGFRRTSMEDIAAEAGVSRAALYLQFCNKEEIFRRLSQALHDESLAQADAALRRREPLVDRLRAAVEAKSLRFVEIAYSSSHGSELMDESNRLCGDLSVQAERRFQGLLARAFRGAAQAGEIDLATVHMSPAEVAELFTRTASGLKSSGVTVAVYRKRVRAWVRLFCAGLRRTPRSATKRSMPRRIAAKADRAHPSRRRLSDGRADDVRNRQRRTD